MMTKPTDRESHRLPAQQAEPTPEQRLGALARMSVSEQLSALSRGEYSLSEWQSIRTAAERLEVLCQLSDEDQLEALRARCFTLSEWYAFARRVPARVCKLGGEFAFIAITTPEWAER